MKILLTKILPLLLPLGIYLTWLYYARRRALAGGGPAPRLRDAPWTVMLLLGLGLLIAGMLALGLRSGEPPGGVYVPSHLEKGEIVPGRIKR